MNSRSPLLALRSVDPAIAGILALSLAAGLIVVTRTWEYGIGLSHDSVWYVSMARELATGHDAFAGEHLRPTWPPLFTLVIAAPGLVGIDPIDAAAVLNPSIFVCTCFVSGVWIYRRTDSGLVSLVVTVALTFSIALTEVSSFVWTEPLFVLLSVCSLALLDRHLRNGSVVALLLAALLAALACLTRYAGVVLLASTVLIVLSEPPVALKKRIRLTLGYLVVAALPLALWLLRNQLLAGTFSGSRPEAVWSFAENATQAGKTLGLWALPWGRGGNDLVLLVSVVPILALLGFALAWVWSSSRSRGVPETISRLMLSDPFVRVVGAYAVLYTAFIIIVSTAIRIDQIGDRLLVPSFVPLALLTGYVLARLIEMSRRDRGRCFRGALAGAIMLFAAVYAAAYFPELRRAAIKGHGYASEAWEASATMAWARRNHGHALLSNRADALYLLVPGVAVEGLPWDASRLPAMVSSIGKRRVVWFLGTRYPYDLADVASDLGLRKVVEFDDGVVFEASRR